MTGSGSLERISREEMTLGAAANLLRVTPVEVPERVEICERRTQDPQAGHVEQVFGFRRQGPEPLPHFLAQLINFARCDRSRQSAVQVELDVVVRRRNRPEGGPGGRKPRRAAAGVAPPRPPGPAGAGTVSSSQRRYRSNPTAWACPDCSAPSRFPAPRISRSLSAIR